jgi:tetratricopeptide (TPR) repeat protein
MKKTQAQKKSKPQTTTVRPQAASKDYSLWFLGFILLLTFIAYLPALKAGFVNWDDDDYVVNNLLIRSFSNLKQMITMSVQGNYHPLTILSLAFNYSVSGQNPWSYHLLNLLFHLLNIYLVYHFASRLSKSAIVATTTALLFALHPMHVESVAWVSERKDVLYTFFFLLGLLSYLKYVRQKSQKHYALSLLWFLLSLASKPAAIIFPMVLFTLDFFTRRKVSLKLFTAKVPFFLFAALVAFLTATAQKTVGATDTANAFTLGNRIFFAFYGYMMYFIKMLVPLNLVAFYPLPPVNQSLPVVYLLSPLFFVATVALCAATWKKYPVVTFGFAFYLVNLLLVLQFFVIGSAVIADRYTYVPYIGLFFLIGWLLDYRFKTKPATAYSIIAGVGVILMFCSYQQASTWESSETLWDNAIKKLPSERAYVNRATLMRKGENTSLAISYYNEAIKLNKLAFTAYCNRGNIYSDMGKDSLALADYSHVLSMKPDFVPALDNRGGLYSHLAKYDLALIDLNYALKLSPDYKTAYKNRAVVYQGMKDYENANRDFQSYLRYEPSDAEIYNAIGVCYQHLAKFDQSLQPFNDAIRLNNSPVYYLNRSFSWNAMGNLDKAREDALLAKQRGLALPPSYASRLGI